MEIFINEIPDEGLHQSGTLSAEAFDLAKSDPIQPIDRKLLFQGQNSSRLRPSGWMGCRLMNSLDGFRDLHESFSCGAGGTSLNPDARKVGLQESKNNVFLPRISFAEKTSNLKKNSKERPWVSLRELLFVEFRCAESIFFNFFVLRSDLIVQRKTSALKVVLYDVFKKTTIRQNRVSSSQKHPETVADQEFAAITEFGADLHLPKCP